MASKKADNKRYNRSDSYRDDFLSRHHGVEVFGYQWFFCSYCGKPVMRQDMQVDHIISVDLVRKRPFYRVFLPKEGVNSIRNLTASCETCNKSKSNKGGIWILKGKIGWSGRMVCCFLLAGFQFAKFLIFSAFMGSVL